jgi:hypothetical protein
MDEEENNNMSNLRSFALCAAGAAVGFSDAHGRAWVLILATLASLGAVLSLALFIIGLFED